MWSNLVANKSLYHHHFFFLQNNAKKMVPTIKTNLLLIIMQWYFFVINCWIANIHYFPDALLLFSFISKGFPRLLFVEKMLKYYIPIFVWYAIIPCGIISHQRINQILLLWVITCPYSVVWKRYKRIQ